MDCYSVRDIKKSQLKDNYDRVTEGDPVFSFLYYRPN
jgi:hypothetical protein